MRNMRVRDPRDIAVVDPPTPPWLQISICLHNATTVRHAPASPGRPRAPSVTRTGALEGAPEDVAEDVAEDGPEDGLDKMVSSQRTMGPHVGSH
jgi:hypothetical protein